MLIRFDGRTAIVAGAARDIGQAIARPLASDRARVFACDLLVDEVVRIAGRLNGAGEIIAAKIDLTGETAIAEVVRAAGGTADILVYVAGGVRGQKRPALEEVTRDDVDAIFDVNLKGAFLFAKAVARGMQGRGTGRTITISSRAGPAMSDRHTKLCRGQTRADQFRKADCPGTWAVRDHREFDRARLLGDQPRLRAAAEQPVARVP